MLLKYSQAFQGIYFALSCCHAAAQISNILSVHKAIYRRMQLRPEMDLYKDALAGYNGT